eukprot:TRINITY_DN12957_c0_g1_i1.p1 TRINITY_DN12957_c0_g1~~TRINITY_DN12957_c0_g1_i1.p1  ORF type:complete len:714 (-),score=188.19 TRINITY_DN12957_c0_g1_i1:160-2301(-)
MMQSPKKASKQYTLLIELEDEGDSDPHMMVTSVKDMDALMEHIATHFSLNYTFSLSLFSQEFLSWIAIDSIQQLKRSPQRKARLMVRKKKETFKDDKSLYEVYKKMIDPTTGIQTKTRKLKVKTYSDSFLAAEAIEWMVRALRVSKAEAALVLSVLVAKRYITNVEGVSFTRFRDKGNVLLCIQPIGDESLQLALPTGQVVPYPELMRVMLLPEEGITIKDRKSGRKTYHKTFVGSEAVSFVSQHLQVRRNVALCILDDALHQEFFHHCTHASAAAVLDDREEIYTVAKSEKVNLDFPAERVITTLRQLRDDDVFEDDNQIADVDYIISILGLGAKNLYKPQAKEMKDADLPTRSLLLYHGVGNNSESPLDTTAQRLATLGHSDLSLMNGTDMCRVDTELLARVQKDILTWGFPVFECSELTGGMPLFYVGLAVFREFGLIDRFHIDQEKLARWLYRIEKGYHHDNPYHNNIHASDVTQTMAFFIGRCGLLSILSDHDVLACVIAAIIHDYDHPGFNNAFLVNTDHEYAIRYNDRSVLESHHCAAAFSVLRDEENYFLSELSSEVYREVRETVIQLVMATDFSRHFDLVGQLQSRKAAGGLDADKVEDRRLISLIALKCADVSHTSKPVDLHKNWTTRVTEEFFHQGDEEKRLGLKVSANFDRDSTNIAKSQVGFIKFLVLPLFQAFCEEADDNATVCLDQLRENLVMWESDA